MGLTVIIPVYNEHGTLPAGILPNFTAELNLVRSGDRC